MIGVGADAEELGIDAFSVTSHAALRWVERVHHAPVEEARREIRQFLAGARPSVRPRRWMGLPPASGDVRYWYNPIRPGVALVVMGGQRVVTVLERSSAAGGGPRRRLEDARQRERRERRR